MHIRSGDEGLARDGRSGATPFLPARHETRSERVQEIRRRIADDAYRSADVAEEIARRILMSREL
ncbi:MAG TPA: hypothetical protein VFS59_01455 [Gemmatimonadaceae bacterium]|nr:hypothetical protein [Gemmatimonadaceae bacterium]